jgi:ComF family protein
VPDGVALCGACLQDPPPFDRCLCAHDYAYPWDRLIMRFKFDQAPELARLLCDGLLAAARHESWPLPQAFVAVPLSAQRLAERGYDQAWQLARQLGRRLHRPAHARLLERRFDSPQQARLSRRERLVNLRGAFGVARARRSQVPGRHLALVDDVMTTGATAHAAAAALLEGGASRVDLWVVARTPAPDLPDG